MILEKTVGSAGAKCYGKFCSKLGNVDSTLWRSSNGFLDWYEVNHNLEYLVSCNSMGKLMAPKGPTTPSSWFGLFISHLWPLTHWLLLIIQLCTILFLEHLLLVSELGIWLTTGGVKGTTVMISVHLLGGKLHTCVIQKQQVRCCVMGVFEGKRIPVEKVTSINS